MSEDTITLSRSYFKELDQKLKKLSARIDQIDILAHDFKRLSKIVSQIDTTSLALRQNFEELRSQFPEINE